MTHFFQRMLINRMNTITNCHKMMVLHIANTLKNCSLNLHSHRNKNRYEQATPFLKPIRAPGLSFLSSILLCCLVSSACRENELRRAWTWHRGGSSGLCMKKDSLSLLPRCFHCADPDLPVLPLPLFNPSVLIFYFRNRLQLRWFSRKKACPVHTI